MLPCGMELFTMLACIMKATGIVSLCIASLECEQLKQEFDKAAAHNEQHLEQIKRALEAS